VLIRSPGLLREYYKNPEATLEVKDRRRLVPHRRRRLPRPTATCDHRPGQGCRQAGRRQLFAPKYIENKLKFFPYIKEAVAFGDGRDRAMAFVNIDFDRLRQLGRAAQRRLRRLPGARRAPRDLVR
jgi:long-chain acyl-CoA synthetase